MHRAQKLECNGVAFMQNQCLSIFSQASKGWRECGGPRAVAGRERSQKPQNTEMSQRLIMNDPMDSGRNVWTTTLHTYHWYLYLITRLEKKKQHGRTWVRSRMSFAMKLVSHRFVKAIAPSMPSREPISSVTTGRIARSTGLRHPSRVEKTEKMTRID